MIFEKRRRILQTYVCFVFLFGIAPSLLNAQDGRGSEFEVRLASDIKWRALNPARGKASPQAGTLWGDQTKEGASGFLVKFVDGFSSPPHIHNITYRGIVLGGALHNDDPSAATFWMPAGSWWTQPAGEAHITSARGASVGYVEIESGPYLVKPSSESFDSGDRPINVHTKNIIWLDALDSSWVVDGSKEETNTARITYLWGNPNDGEINGTMVKLPPGFSGSLVHKNSTFKVVVIKGSTKLHQRQNSNHVELPAGSYFGTKGPSSHSLSCKDECVIYVRSSGKYMIRSE